MATPLLLGRVSARTLAILAISLFGLGWFALPRLLPFLWAWGERSLDSTPLQFWAAFAAREAVVKLALLALALTLLWFVRGSEEWRATVARWFGKGWFMELLLGLTLAVPVLLAVVLLHGPDGVGRPALDHLPLVGVAVLVGPPAEEVIYRGFLFGILWREVRLPPMGALFLSSVLFGAAHWSLGAGISWNGLFRLSVAGGVGAALCWAAWKRGGNLGFAIGGHVGLNAGSSVVGVLMESLTDAESRLFGCFLVLVAVLGCILLKPLQAGKARTPANGGSGT